METAGYEIKHGRGGTISFLAPGWKQPTRLRASKLGEGYDPEDIRAIITGFGNSAETPARRVNLIVDIQKRLREGKGTGYERWARVFNLKQMAAALVYLQENGLLEYDRLVEKAEETAKQFHALAGQIKDIEAELAVNQGTQGGHREILRKLAQFLRNTRRQATAGRSLLSMKRNCRFIERHGRIFSGF